VSSSSYDDVPYSKKPYPQSHPDRLAVLATLFGMNPAPIDHCRVLELGGGSGGNIIPMASSLPGSRFLGIELSARQVADGRATIDAAGLGNIEIRQLDILGATESIGTFDYIIAHGVYSWVPDEVKEKLLQLCSETLSPSGVAYVSYNTQPGWHFRGMVRDMMLYHTRELPDPSARIAHARALLAFFAQSAPADNPYAAAFKAELEVLGKHSDSYLFHDHLEDFNDPVYFHVFADRASHHGLQYLAEADFGAMRQATNFPPEVGKTLRGLSNELVKTEQYMDILRSRRFRQTLLCRKEIALERNLTPQSIMGFEIASPARPLSAQVDVRSSQPEAFQTPNGVTFTSTDPLIKAAFCHLSEIWPQSVSFDGLVKAADPSRSDVQALAAQILEGYAHGFVVLRSRKAPFVTALSDRPVASALARHQAKTGDLVTNQLHESGLVDDFDRHMLQLLDGSNDRKAVVESLAKLVENGTLRSSNPGSESSRGEPLRRNLAKAVEDGLGHFAKLALLVG
jgi:methyltransferase-like protein